MWHGTKDDLTELVNVVERLRSDAVHRLQNELDAKRAEKDRAFEERTRELKEFLIPPERITFRDKEARERFTRTVDALLDETRPSRDAYDVRDAESRIADLSMRLNDRRRGGSSIEDNPDVVLPIMHPRQTKNMDVEFGSTIYEPYLSLKFDQDQGVTVTARSSDLTWMSGVLDQLKAKLSQKKPWYAFAASPWLGLPLCWFISIIVGATLSLWLRIPTDDAIFWPTVMLSGTVLLYTLWSRVLFSRFEMYNSGSQSTVRAVSGGVVALIGLASAVIALLSWLPSAFGA